MDEEGNIMKTIQLYNDNSSITEYEEIPHMKNTKVDISIKQD